MTKPAPVPLVPEVSLVEAVPPLAHVDRLQAAVQGFQDLTPSLVVAHSVAQGEGVPQADDPYLAARHLDGEFTVVAEPQRVGLETAARTVDIPQFEARDVRPSQERVVARMRPLGQGPPGESRQVIDEEDRAGEPFEQDEADHGHAGPAEDFDDPLRRLAVPEIRDSPPRGPAVQDLRGFLDDPAGVVTYQDVRPLGEGHGPFGVVPERQAGDAQDGGLLLDPARVGQDQARVLFEVEEVQVPERLDGPES